MALSRRLSSRLSMADMALRADLREPRSGNPTGLAWAGIPSRTLGAGNWPGPGNVAPAHLP